MGKGEPFKLNEFRFEIVCLACDERYGFSENNFVHCITPMKANLLDLIEVNIMKNKTLTIEMVKT